MNFVNLSLQNKTLIQLYSIFLCLYTVVWDSVVVIATCYKLHNLGIESQWGWIFCTHPDWPWSPPNTLYNGYQVFPGGTAATAWHWPPTSTQVKERVELYTYSTSEPLWLVLGQTLPLPLLLPLCLYTSPLRTLVSCIVLEAVLTLCLHDS
jgi:hypothetical protein